MLVKKTMLRTILVGAFVLATCGYKIKSASKMLACLSKGNTSLVYTCFRRQKMKKILRIYLTIAVSITLPITNYLPFQTTTRIYLMASALTTGSCLCFQG